MSRDPLLAKSYWAVLRAGPPQVDRHGAVSLIDRERPPRTALSDTQRARAIRCWWAQPDPPLGAAYLYKTEHVAARDAADFRPLNPISKLFIRLTLPFLSRVLIERLCETLRACRHMTRMNTPISAGIEFNPAALTITTLGPDHLFPRSGRPVQNRPRVALAWALVPRWSRLVDCCQFRRQQVWQQWAVAGRTSDRRVRTCQLTTIRLDYSPRFSRRSRHSGSCPGQRVAALWPILLVMMVGSSWPNTAGAPIPCSRRSRLSNATWPRKRDTVQSLGRPTSTKPRSVYVAGLSPAQTDRSVPTDPFLISTG